MLCLFNDAVSGADYTAFNVRIISDERIRQNRTERSASVQPGYCLQGLSKHTKILALHMLFL